MNGYRKIFVSSPSLAKLQVPIKGTLTLTGYQSLVITVDSQSEDLSSHPMGSQFFVFRFMKFVLRFSWGIK